MWLSFFSIAAAASICLSVAAIMLQAASQEESCTGDRKQCG
jgi:hypothetical protein